MTIKEAQVDGGYLALLAGLMAMAILLAGLVADALLYLGELAIG